MVSVLTAVNTLQKRLRHQAEPSDTSLRYWKQRRETGHNDEFPGLESRKVDMRPYNRPLPPLDRRQLLYYRVIGSTSQDPNLHACAHLYASDRNSLFIVANNLDVGDKFTQMASLSHTVVFHTPIADMMMTDEQGDKVWFCKEDWTTRAAGGRGIHQSRMIGPKGVHVASSWQEGMVRVGTNEKAQKKAAEKGKL